MSCLEIWSAMKGLAKETSSSPFALWFSDSSIEKAFWGLLCSIYRLNIFGSTECSFLNSVWLFLTGRDFLFLKSSYIWFPTGKDAANFLLLISLCTKTPPLNLVLLSMNSIRTFFLKVTFSAMVVIFYEFNGVDMAISNPASLISFLIAGNSRLSLEQATINGAKYFIISCWF